VDDLEAAVRVTEAIIPHLNAGAIIGRMVAGEGDAAAIQAGERFGVFFDAIYKAVVKAQAHDG